MHKVQRSMDSPQSQTSFPLLDEVTVQLFIDHAAAKLKTAPPVVKSELKEMVPSGPPLGECEHQIRLRIAQNPFQLTPTDPSFPHIFFFPLTFLGSKPSTAFYEFTLAFCPHI